MSNQDHEEEDFDNFLAGGGEMGERTRTVDWTRTPLGSVRSWPQSLRSALSICLNSNFPIAIYWGSDLALLYNDSWSPILGEKHPWALGRPACEAWSEIWQIIDPLFKQVIKTGEAARRHDQLLPMHRHGFTEECYFDYTFSPIRGESGQVEGVFNAVIETTNRVIGERRLRTLRQLTVAEAESAVSVEDACQAAARVLNGNQHDLPFVFLYLLDDDRRRAELVGASGLAANHPASPSSVDLDQADAPWPFRQVIESGNPVEIVDLLDKFGSLPGGAWPEPPQRAVVLPMAKPGQMQLAGFVVAGISPRLNLNDEYRGFLDLLAGHVAAVVASARAYAEEKQRAEKLAELDRAKTAFFSNVSHEFRTPLTLMLGPVENMLSRSYTELSPSARGQLDVVNRNGLRLLRLVNSLLDFSRIEAGRVRAAFQPTDLTAYTTDLASVFRAACERAGLRLTVDCSQLAEPVFVDRDMWEKIVLNLLSNAFKFTFEGEIGVTLRAMKSAAVLCVRDTGTGIPTEEMPRLFERFHRVENARGRTHEGSGIGLALVQELVKLHGGSITAESVMDSGTTFTVTVPLGSDHLSADQIGELRGLASTGTGAIPYVEEALRWLPDEVRGEDQSELPSFREPLSVSAVSAQQDQCVQRPHVMVADDNADMRQYVVHLLSEQYSVVAVTNGQAALDAARQQPPDLILSDVMMPLLDGFGLLRELRAEPRTRAIPVIMLSARAGEESRVEGMEAGADDYLVKPFSARELLARVRAHLQMARLRRESEQAVRKSEERLRMALTAARMVAWQLDPSSGKLEVSNNAAKVFGLLSKTTLEHSDAGFALLHPDDVERHRAKVQRAIDECGSFVSHFRIIRPDNDEIVWLEDRGHGVPNDSGETKQLIGVMIDITERKSIEEEFQKERDLLSVTLASIGDAVVTTDTAGRVTNLNGVAERLTRWSNTDAAGKPLDKVFQIVNEETRQPVVNPVTRALEEGIIVGLANHTVLIAKDGTEVPTDDSAAPILSENGKMLGCVLIFRDVSQRRRQESLLSNQNKVLEQVIRSGPLVDILDTVCLAVERNIDSEAIATVLLADANGTFLRPAAGPRCPEEYSAALASVPIGPNCGSCGSAAHLGEPVLVDDIANDPLWADYRHLALQHGLRACWSVPIFSSMGTILGTFAVYLPSPRKPSDQDIQMTEFLARTAGIAIQRYHAEEAIRDSELRYRLVGQAANDAIWDWNLVTNQVIWNEGLKARFGYTEEQIGTDASWWIEHIHPDDRARVTQSIHATIDSDEELWNDEYRYRRADGSYAEVYDRGRVVREGGKPIRMVGSMLDLTERNKSQDALRESEERFRGIFTQTLAGIAETDLTGRFVEANHRYCEIVGRSAEELQSMRMQDITHPDDLSSNLPLFKRAVEEGTPFVIEKRYVRPDGSYVWVNNSVSLVRDEQNRPKHIVAASLDITANKHSEAALRESERNARQASISKSEFLANMSHEIRTPMAAILGHADVLLTHLKDADDRSCVETIQRNGNHLLELINDILDLSRIEAGKLDVELESCRLAEILADIWSLMHIRVEGRAVDLQVICNGKFPSVIATDPKRLRQILINLIGNAIKFTEEGQVKLLVSCVRHEEQYAIRFEVQDTGIGISQEHMAKLFKPFSQADASVTRKFGGTGLGLSISERLVNMLGGQLTVESEFGVGSTFCVELPIGELENANFVECEIDRMSSEAETPRRKESLSCRVLLVDDRRDVRFVAQHILEGAGATISTATNGREGIDAIRSADKEKVPFDIVVMDMQMPIMDGYAATSELRAKGFDRPIIAMTANAMAGDAERCLNAGCDDYQSKPVDATELISKVYRLTETISLETLQANRDQRNAANRVTECESP